MVELLPHQYPFRLVDAITRYVKGEGIHARFHQLPLYPYFGKGATMPSSLLIEGLAQVAVLFTQLETRPLQPHEVPLLGKIEADVAGKAVWDQPLAYELSPIRMFCKQAILYGVARQNGGPPIVSATLMVSISDKGRRRDES